MSQMGWLGSLRLVCGCRRVTALARLLVMVDRREGREVSRYLQQNRQASHLPQPSACVYTLDLVPRCPFFSFHPSRDRARSPGLTLPFPFPSTLAVIPAYEQPCPGR